MLPFFVIEHFIRLLYLLGFLTGLHMIDAGPFYMNKSWSTALTIGMVSGLAV